MSLLKRYWIAGLVLCLVIIHAVIIGYVRAEATRVKVTASNEIPIGVYYVQSRDKQWLSQLRVHLLVLPEQRLAAKATIEHHRWLIHEVVEEKLRQLEPSLLGDAVLLEIKAQIKSVIEDTLQEQIIERVLVNDRVDLPVDNFHYDPPYNVTEPEAIYTSKKITTPVEELEEIEKD
ncbi:MAG: hypothetical protein R3C53_15375 [Pirellulaceae bacterium]